MTCAYARPRRELPDRVVRFTMGQNVEPWTIEWLEEPEQSAAAMALVHAWRERRSLLYGLGGVVVAIAVVMASDTDWRWLASAVLMLTGLGFLWRYWASRAWLDRGSLGRWIAGSRTRRPEGFREPASSATQREGEMALSVRLDGDGFRVTGRGWLERTVRWAGVRSVRTLFGGHVMLAGRSGIGDTLVPAWAFEAEHQRTLFVERARALHRAGDPRLSAAFEAPPLDPRSDEEVSITAAWTLRTLVAQIRAVPVSLETRARDARGPFFSICFAYLLAPPSLRALASPSLAFAAALVFGFVYTSDWGRALRAIPRVRRHIVTRARFSESGVAFASALGSSIRTWKHTKLVRYTHATLVDGFILPNAWLTSAEAAALDAWKRAAPEPPPVATFAKDPSRAWLIAGAGLAAFFGLYWLVTHDAPEQRAEHHIPQLDQPPTYTIPGPSAECPLPPSVMPGTALEENRLRCAGLGEGNGVRYCAATGHRIVDAAAVVDRPQSIDLWLRVESEWQAAGPLWRWSDDEAPRCSDVAIHALQLRAGGPPELLVTMDCVMHAGTRRRLMSACGLDEFGGYCWSTIPVAEAQGSPPRDPCRAWSYEVRSWATRSLLDRSLADLEQERADVRAGRRDDSLVLEPAGPSSDAPPSGWSYFGILSLDDLVLLNTLPSD